jgi:hypothetical protein
VSRAPGGGTLGLEQGELGADFTALGESKVTAEELLARVESNRYKKGAHREKDSARDEKRYIDKIKKVQNATLDRCIL